MTEKTIDKNQFLDDKNRIWTFRITGKSLRRLHNLGFKPSDVSDPLVVERVMDTAEVLDLMAAVLVEQLDERGIVADQLFEDFDGDILLDASWAFIYGCIFFMPSHMRKPMLVWVEKMQQAQQRLTLLMEEKVESVDMESALTDLVNKTWNEKVNR